MMNDFMKQGEGEKMPEMREDLKTLSQEKEKIRDKIDHSQAFLKELEEKRKTLAETLAQKILEAKEEEKEKLAQKRKEVTERLIKARSYFRNGHYEQAISEWESVLILEENNSIALSGIETAEKKLSELSEGKIREKEIYSKKERERIEYYNLARKKIREGKDSDAVEILEETMRVYGSDAETCRLLAECESRLKDKDIQNQQKHQEQERKKKEVIKGISLGRHYLFKAEYTKAVEQYENCLLLDPENSVALEGLKTCQEKLSEEAEVNARREEEQKKRLREIQLKAMRLSRNGDYFQAIEALEEILVDCPDSVYAETMEKIRELELLYRQKTEKDVLDIQKKQENMAESQKERERSYVERLHESEALSKGNRNLDALYKLRRLMVDYPEKEELKEKAQELSCLLKREEEERSKEQEILREKDALKNKIAETECAFRKALLKKDVKEAILLLEDLKHQGALDKDLKVRLVDHEEQFKKVKEQEDKCEIARREAFISNLKKGLQYYQLGEYGEAYLYFKDAGYDNPADEDASNFKIRTFQKFNENESKKERDSRLKEEFQDHYQRLKIRVSQLIRENHFEEAIAEGEKAALLFPGNELILKEIGSLKDLMESYRIEERSREMREQEERAAKNRMSIQELLVKGHIEMKRGLWKEAQDYFYRALELDPENKEIVDYIQQIDSEKRRENQNILEAKERQERENKEVNRLLWEGERLFYAGDYDKAILIYEKILELDYKHEGAHKAILELKRHLRQKIERDMADKVALKDRIKDMAALSAKLYASGSYAEALSLCQEVLFYDSENKPVKELRDRIIEEKKREDALREERARFREEELRAEKEKQEMKKQKQMEEIRTIYKIGLEYFQKNDYERAIEEWEKAEFIQPSNPLIKDEIRRAKIRIKEKEIEAIQINEMKDQKERQINQAVLEGRMLLRNNEVEKAVQVWERAMVIFGSDSRLMKELEKAEDLLQEKRDKNEKERKEKEEERKNIERLIFMANRYFNDGQYEKMIEILEKALIMDPDNVEIKNGILNAEDKIRELGISRNTAEERGTENNG